MIWASYILATRPDVQDKLRTEVLNLLSKVSVPDAGSIDGMRYLHNFCQEILRVYNPGKQAKSPRRH